MHDMNKKNSYSHFLLYNNTSELSVYAIYFKERSYLYWNVLYELLNKQ